MKRHKFGIAIILAAIIFVTCTACNKSNQANSERTKENSASSYIDSISEFLSSAISSETPSKAAVSSPSSPAVIPVTGISLSKTRVSLEVGNHTMPIVTMSPKNATNKGEIWESSNTKVATVNQYGSIKAVNVGFCMVTVISASNKNVVEKVSVIVTPKPVTAPAQPVQKPIINTTMDVRAQSFGSSTSYLILVDLANQKVGIYRGSQGSWNLSQSYICSTGVGGGDATPTGTFTIHSRGTWFFSKSEQMGAEWWTQFNGDFLFHSLPMDQNRNIVDATLGKPASHGCVRLPVENAKWIYDNVPRGTTVNIY